LQFIKKSCKNSRYPLQDIYNQIIEQVNIQTCCSSQNYPILENEINSNELSNSLVYEKMVLNNFIVSSKNIRDKYFILNNQDIVEINKIIKDINEQINLLITTLNYCVMFQNPISSCITKTFYINNINSKSQLKLIDYNCLKYKCLYLPTNNKSIAIALLHDL